MKCNNKSRDLRFQNTEQNPISRSSLLAVSVSAENQLEHDPCCRVRCFVNLAWLLSRDLRWRITKQYPIIWYSLSLTFSSDQLFSMHSIKHKYNWPISVQWIRPIMSPTVTISRKTWSDVLPYVCSQILSTSYVCNGTISARNDVITPRALTIHVCRPHFVMNFKPIYLRLNIVQFQKGRHPRIQLTEIFKIRVVDLKSEKLHKKGRTLVEMCHLSKYHGWVGLCCE